MWPWLFSKLAKWDTTIIKSPYVASRKVQRLTRTAEFVIVMFVNSVCMGYGLCSREQYDYSSRLLRRGDDCSGGRIIWRRGLKHIVHNKRSSEEKWLLEPPLRSCGRNRLKWSTWTVKIFSWQKSSSQYSMEWSMSCYQKDKIDRQEIGKNFSHLSTPHESSLS